jgi:ribosomal protein L21E
VGKEGGVTGDGRISEIGEGAAEKARRGLRRDGEERLAEGSKRFLQAFGEVDKVSLS